MSQIVKAFVAVVRVVASFFTGNAVGRVVAQIALTAAVAALSRMLQPKPRGMNQGQELQTKIDPAYPREIMVGKTATGGSLVYENVSGANNEYLWNVIALSDGEIEAIDEVQGNGKALTFSGDIHTGLRACTSHFQSASGGDMLYCRIYKGTDAQTADPDLDAAFTEITSNFRGRGIAYAILRKQYDPDAWAGGADNFVFIGRGAKNIYDPRTGTTAYSANLALIARQFLKGFTINGVRVVGFGATETDLPVADWNAAANECDEAVTLAASGTEPRYAGGGMISARSSAREVLTDLCAAMAASHIDRGGEIIILPGVARTAIMDLTETDMLSDAPITFAGKRTANDRFNAISSTFVSPTDNWQESALPPRKDAAAITADGDRLETSRAYRFCTSKTQGQRLDEIELRRARKEATISCVAPLWAFELTPGDWVTWTNPRWGGVSKTFEVQSVELAIVNGAAGGDLQARCALSMRETAASVYSWSTTDEITNAVATTTQPAPLLSNFDANGRLVGGLFAGNPLLTGAVGTRNPLAVLSYTDAGSTETVSIASHTLKTSDANGAQKSVSYNSGSVTGLAFSTAYHISAYDPTFAGGAVTYVASTSPDTYITNNGYVYIGYITTGADGGGGGSPPPPPPECVSVDAWVDVARRAGDIVAGDLIDALAEDMISVEPVLVDNAHDADVAGVRLVTTSGVVLTCSTTTPITQPSGATVLAGRALGAQVAVQDAAGLRWETIVQKDGVGPIRVRRIHCGGRTYAAGDNPDRRMFTHNPLK